MTNSASRLSRKWAKQVSSSFKRGQEPWGGGRIYPLNFVQITGREREIERERERESKREKENDDDDNNNNKFFEPSLFSSNTVASWRPNGVAEISWKSYAVAEITQLQGDLMS